VTGIGTGLYLDEEKSVYSVITVTFMIVAISRQKFCVNGDDLLNLVRWCIYP